MLDQRVLERGTEGEDVQEIQKILAKMGYDIGRAGADGKFGAKTESAVKQFQSEMNQQYPEANIVIDGKVDRHTWIFLRKNRS